MSRFGPLVGCVLLLLVGCDSAGTSIDWRIALGAGLRPEPGWSIRTRVLRGGCGSDEVLYEEHASFGSEPSRRPSELEPGRHAFDARATDGACVVVAQACSEVTVPHEGRVELLLTAIGSRPSACGPAERCVDGRCEGATPPIDGGVPSARIPIYRVTKLYTMEPMPAQDRVAFTAEPGAPGAPSGGGAAIDFWALAPTSPDGSTCPTGTTPLLAYASPSATDPRQTYYATAPWSDGAGYVEVPPFACVPVAPAADVVPLHWMVDASRHAGAHRFVRAEQRAELAGFVDQGEAFLVFDRED
ncbi:MAG: hypothetical protein IT379_14165 [Deltaproteobacteria bacterium]|nr:hypothetical protein [Deltaproteobacteria bacterium]